MAIKKSDLYSSLWASCDELRGGMDASQYKDYVLFMLFIKYVSDKYGHSEDLAPPVKIPKGASFQDMVALQNDSDIGDKINKQVIQPLIDANSRLARSDFPDFNDPNKLGDGAARVEKLSNLIAIFQKPELDFSKNRAEHDDILGDAYEQPRQHSRHDFSVPHGRRRESQAGARTRFGYARESSGRMEGRRCPRRPGAERYFPNYVSRPSGDAGHF
jgi:type I restriction enzyme M protein